jgi:K+-transporting ATPase ATPase C chain
MVAFAGAAFPSQASGSLLYHDGHVVGSSLAAQDFTGAQYFHERPSATTPAYDAAATTFANYGPTSTTLAQNVHQQAEAILKLEGPYNPGLTSSDIPVDAVTTSGSGIDPDISIAYADLQSRRVAAVRHLPLATVQRLISDYTTGRSLGVLGEPGVNVLDLNLALDNLGEK